MKILVAGGFGFIGGRIAQALQAAGHELVLGSRTTPAPPVWLPAAQVRLMNWQSPRNLLEACAGIDCIVHAAGMNAADCAANPPMALQVNGVGAARLVEAAIAAGVTRFFYFSTAHVYASPLQGEINEESCPRNLHPYASSHLAGEYALLDALARNNIAGSSLRLSNGFGSPMAVDTRCWTLLANDLCRQAVTKGKLVLQSSGEQLRDFVPLSSVCEGVTRLLSLPTASLPPILNIGSGYSISVLAMAEVIQSRCQAILGYTPALEVGASKETTRPLRYTSLYGQRLGLTSVDPVEEIDALLEFCKMNFAA